MKSFLESLEEDAPVAVTPANVTGDSATMAMPPASARLMRRYRAFDVEPGVFKKFETGRVKFERWSKYLDMNNDNHKKIYEYATKNKKHVIILRNSENGALRAIRRRSEDGQ
jgi:hypothetical protein